MKDRLRVAVTGGSGKIGRAAIASLQRAGHFVVNFDLKPSSVSVRTTIADFADFGTVMGALSGVDLAGGSFDAVVHLAGIPAPGLAPDHRVFEINTLSTYNIFSACRRLGIRRIAWASSETLLGQPYSESPPFLPLDESVSHPEWSYSLSKQLGETMAESFARWAPGTSIVSLRFSNVYEESDYAALPKIQAQPETRRVNLWGYVDARDCGEACRLAIEVAPPGHEALIIAAADNVAGLPARELAARFFPGVQIYESLDGDSSLISINKARRVIGYTPQHSWRQQLRS